MKKYNVTYKETGELLFILEAEDHIDARKKMNKFFSVKERWADDS